MGFRFVRSVGFAVVVAIACASISCSNAPTLPLPPPVAEVSPPDAQGFALVEGEVAPRAFVSVFNLRLESGVITRADTQGTFSVEIEAVVGDTLTIWQESDGETGERKETVVPGPEPDSAAP
jgi:hypothetical protein